ncbi:MAG TPA: VWA domain-containing protein [Arenimonas sp.]|nr:VWA domain-containing protein [Arenimonas sp.]
MSRIRLTLLASAVVFALGTGCARQAETRAEGPAEADGRAQAAATAKAEQRERAELAARKAEAQEATLDFYQVAPAPLAAPPPPPPAGYAPMPEVNTENYAQFEDNGIVRTADNPVSTFSIDVDTGSYSNVRRMLNAGRLPPKDAVRVEEMLNYFDYAYPAPASRAQPFATRVELAPAPWDEHRLLMHVGLKGYSVPAADIPAANLVFLIDTSGSMYSPDKLPLLKQAFSQLASRLRAQDRVSIVAYAGSAGLVLPPTPGDRHGEILDALNRLQAGGSTNGGEGIELAYAVAKQAFIENGVNRILLASDGDFNVGIYDPRALETRIEAGRKSGVAFSVLGFGGGNYNDALAEKLADVGNGHYAYIDNLMEARKVLVEEMGSTLLTIASDVKIQVEFNPATVAEYRLVGYENRTLAREDFNNDKVDAGEIGAGHDVTAIYEVCLHGMGCDSADPLRYGNAPAATPHADELAFLKLRYKRPGEERSVLVEQPVKRSQIGQAASEDLRFAAAVVAFADLLRGGGNTGDFDWARVEALARDARGDDPWGYRGEFLQLVGLARGLSEARQPGVAGIHEE